MWSCGVGEGDVLVTLKYVDVNAGSRRRSRRQSFHFQLATGHAVVLLSVVQTTQPRRLQTSQTANHFTLGTFKTDALKIDALDHWCLRQLLGIKWHHYVRNDEVRRTAGQPHLSVIVQARRFFLFSHIARIPDETDAKNILAAASLENWRRPPGRPRTTLMKTIQQDLKSKNLSRKRLETDVYVWRDALLMEHARKEEEGEHSLDITNHRNDSYRRTLLTYDGACSV